ncbi:MAG: Holliday junction resolvase RuvX [Clostridia bacterium]|nr:Holliday junction resolvase RuvX [Clostridia bacterium]
MTRYLGVDLGDRRIGLAVSDPLCITAQGLETYVRAEDSPAADADYIAALCAKYAPCRIVMGMPRNMDGSYGPAAHKAYDFAQLLEARTGEAVDFYDERLSTVMAERVLYEQKLDWKKRRKVVDKLAAVVILQGYMDGGCIGDRR